MRYLAALLLLAHLGSIAGPALAYLPDGDSEHACANMHAQADYSAVAEASGECEMCEMMGCSHMRSCSAVSAAMVSSGTPTLVVTLLVSSSFERAEVTASLAAQPNAPPPRA